MHSTTSLSYLWTMLTAAGVLTLLIWASACNTKSTIHPGAIDQFDSDSYDSMLTAHAALVALEPSVAASHPEYRTLFNELVTSYNTALPIYTLYHQKQGGSQAQVSAQIANVVVAVIALENQFRMGMGATPTQVQAASAKVFKTKGAFQSRGITIGDIMTYLQLGAAIAETIPGASPYVGVAELVIHVAETAVANLTAANGKPIDLTAIAVIQPIPV